MAYIPLLLPPGSKVNSKQPQAGTYYVGTPVNAQSPLNSTLFSNAQPSVSSRGIPTTDNLRDSLRASLGMLTARISDIMHDFYGVDQGVRPNDALVTPVFGLSFTAPANAKQNADKTVKLQDLGSKHGIAAEDIFAASRLMTGLMLLNNVGNDAWGHDLGAPAGHPLLGAIAAVVSGNAEYASAHPMLYEVAQEAIDEAVNTACGNDLRSRAQFRNMIANGADPKVIGHLVKAIIGELVSFHCGLKYPASIPAHTSARADAMPLDVRNAIDDLPLAVAEGYNAWAQNNAPSGSVWGGPIGFLLPTRGELEAVNKAAMQVPAFRLYPMCLRLAVAAGQSFFSVAEGVGLDPLCVLSSAAAICGCSFAVVWPVTYLGGRNYHVPSQITGLDHKTGKIVVAREVHTQALAKSLFCVTHDWNSGTQRVESKYISAENDIIAMLGNMCCRHTDVMLYNEDDKSVRHAHTLDTRLLPGKLNVGLPPSFAWTNVSRTGILASAKFQAEQIFLGRSLEGTMLETRKYCRELYAAQADAKVTSGK